MLLGLQHLQMILRIFESESACLGKVVVGLAFLEVTLRGGFGIAKAHF